MLWHACAPRLALRSVACGHTSPPPTSRPMPWARTKRFMRAIAGVAGDVDLAMGPDAIRRHLAGSGGVLGAAVSRWDAVRVGLAAYGLVPDALGVPASTARDRVRAAARHVARRAAGPGPRRCRAGHGVSYGPTFVTARPSRIATLPVGYGDGWRRTLSDRADALVRGRPRRRSSGGSRWTRSWWT